MEEACGVVMALIIGFVCYAVAVIYTCRPTGENHAESQAAPKTFPQTHHIGKMITYDGVMATVMDFDPHAGTYDIMSMDGPKYGVRLGD